MKAYPQRFLAVAAKALNGAVRHRAASGQSVRKAPGATSGSPARLDLDLCRQVSGEQHSFPRQEIHTNGPVTGGRKRRIAFLVLVAALLALEAAWSWTPLQDWLSPQRVAKFITRFPYRARALVIDPGVGLASVLASPPGLPLSLPLTTTLYC